MFTLYIENHEHFWVIDKELPIAGQEQQYSVHIFNIYSLQIGSHYHSKAQLCLIFRP